MGAVAGDHVGYYFGRWIGPRFHETKFAKKYEKRIHKTEQMILNKGPYAIFIGRFIPAIRSLVPMMTGVSGFKPSRYSIYDVIACLIWASLLGAMVFGIDKIF